ncbi:MAG: hypothetical protein ACI9HY_001174 [Planctomycetaceae bacterium]|jgi:hypothetical protein
MWRSNVHLFNFREELDSTIRKDFNMPDQWMIQATTFANCNCLINCGCQFNVPTSHGFCNFVMAGHINQGNFNDTSLSGLNYASIFAYPGEIAEGNGKQLIVVDESANNDQRVALQKILSGQVGEPGSNHFSVFSSMCSELLETEYLPIEIEVDIAARKALLKVPGLIQSIGEPAINAFNGEPFHIAIARPSGSFEYTYAELGLGTSTVRGAMEMQLDSSYGQFCTIHYNQEGLIRAA